MPKAETNLVEYGSYTEEAAEYEKSMVERSGGAFRRLKPKRNRLRILPPPAGKDSPFEIVHNHFVALEGEEGTVIVRCPRMMSKGKKFCPICKKVEKLANSGSPLDRDAGRALKAKQAAIANTIDRDDPDSGVMPMSCIPYIYNELNKFRNDPDDPCDFTHPLEGRDVWIDRTGTGKKDTRYTVRLAPRASKLADTVSEMNELILSQPDITKYASLPTDDELLSLAKGQKFEEEANRLPADTRRSRRRDNEDDYIDAEIEEEDTPV